MTSHQSPEGLHALVFGASGISGWALMSTCLTYPTTRTFSRIIGLTHRPLDPKDALLPMEEQKRWELHSGFDLSRGVDPVKEKLGRIGGLEEVTHVFFACRYLSVSGKILASVARGGRGNLGGGR